MKSTISHPNIKIIIIFVLFFIVIEPWLLFWFGYLSGILAKIMVGDILVMGINTILKTNLSKDQIPLIAGTFAWVGSYFKTLSSTTAKE